MYCSTISTALQTVSYRFLLIKTYSAWLYAIVVCLLNSISLPVWNAVLRNAMVVSAKEHHFWQAAMPCGDVACFHSALLFCLYHFHLLLTRRYDAFAKTSHVYALLAFSHLGEALRDQLPSYLFADFLLHSTAVSTCTCYLCSFCSVSVCFLFGVLIDLLAPYVHFFSLYVDFALIYYRPFNLMRSH